MSVVKPSTPDEFTICLDVAGQRVRRPLREMKAYEVMAALDWHTTENERLERERPLNDVMEPKERKRVAHYVVEVSSATCALIAQVHTILHPCWRYHPGMDLEMAIRRFWPNGR
jgi:hypothetical protein